MANRFHWHCRPGLLPEYCANTHGAIAKHQLEGNEKVVKDVMNDPSKAEVSDKLKALFRIVAKVQVDGKKVTPEDIAYAKEQGATDKEIHDTVLITAAFSMYNRYVDGLGTWAPEDPAVYDAIGKQRASEGYLTKPFKVTQS